jgi:chitodextrinase
MDARSGLCVSLALAVALVMAPSAQAAPPNASFAFAPDAPNEGEPVTFSAAVAWGGDEGEVSWDFGDGTTGTGSDVEHVFTSGGSKQVKMTATNNEGGDSETRTIDVNPRPSVAFSFSPQMPGPGEPVLFAPDVSDDDAVTYWWDFGDGSTTTGSGPNHAYSTPGVRTVTLAVTDSEGAVGTASLQVDVHAPSQPAAALQPSVGIRLPVFMSPFPIVRLSGQLLDRATLIRLLTVRGPRGAVVRVRCAGRDCPTNSARRRVTRTGVVRFHAFERPLRPGTRLAIFVRRGAEIGKYTRFAIRAGDRPLRTDRCLLPGQRRPIRCPG